MNPDFLDIIRALLDAEARFIIVGAYALNLCIDPRATKVMQALKQFGAPLSDVIESDLARPGVTLQIGIAPRRIDLLTELSGIEFDEAWKDRSMFPFGPFTIPFLSKASLIKNKRAIGRPKDLLDIEELEKS